jgi:hypothetical protein
VALPESVVAPGVRVMAPGVRVVALMALGVAWVVSPQVAVWWLGLQRRKSFLQFTEFASTGFA